MDAPTQTDQQIHEALYDGADLAITYRDGRHDAVKVRKIPRNEFAALSLVIGDESETGELAEAALYVAATPPSPSGRTLEWAATLDDESLTRVIEEGHRLNFFTFARWWRRRGMVLNLMSGQTETLRAAVQVMRQDPKLSALLDSTNGSAARAIPTPTSGGSARTN